MASFSKLAGTILSFFTYSTTGAGINANGAALETKNNSNSAFAVHRGAPPVGANDFVTLGSIISAAGVCNCIVVTPGTAASSTSTAQIPAGAIVYQCQADVTTDYSPGTTIEVGFGGTLAAFMGTGDNTATTLGLYINPQQTTVVAAENVVVTIGGGPAVGVSEILVFFVVPLT